MPDVWLAKAALAGQGSWQRKGAKQGQGSWTTGHNLPGHWVPASKTMVVAETGLRKDRAPESACLAANPSSSTGKLLNLSLSLDFAIHKMGVITVSDLQN